jgi:hypothetical protein
VRSQTPGNPPLLPRNALFYGVVLDDVISGLYANLTLRVLAWLGGVSL